jgi:hypothetical protein
MRCPIALTAAVCLLATHARAQNVPAIKEIASIAPEHSVFDAGAATRPLVLNSEKEASEHFSKDELAKLTREVDFSKQFVLVFAWRGSGGDRLSYTVAESSPEQVAFTLTRGRTRDLRPHLHIYALRTGVKWSVR